MNTYHKYQMVNKTVDILNAMHIKQPVHYLLEKHAQERALVKLSRIKPGARQVIDEPKKIIFHTMYGSYHSAIYKDGAMAKALQLLGHDVKLLFCGGLLNVCTPLFTEDNKPNSLTCKNCQRFSKQFCDTVHLSYSDYFNYFDNETLGNVLDNKDKDVYNGVNIHKHALASATRYSKGDDISEQVLDIHHINAMMVSEVAKNILEKEKPDAIVESHGCYAEWGTFRDFFQQNNVPVFTWFTGYNPQTLIFDLDKIDTGFNRYYNQFRNKKPLNAGEKSELEQHISKRVTGTDDTLLYGFKKENFVSKKFVTTFGLFPNVPWDADPTCKTLFFDSVSDWVCQTIKLFEKYPESQLIVRVHPAEVLHKSQFTVMDSINEQFDTLPNNIHIIPPESKISSYDLFDQIDVGIVSSSTVGLEMLLNDIPVVTVGQAHYSKKGFTYDPKTKLQYKKMLFSKLVIKNKELRDIYAYYYFIKSFIPFRVLYIKNLFNFGWDIKSYNDLLEDEYLTHITDCILNGKLMQSW